jgi:radical SAM superfamily enzyme YgiQ (UPF0313 family)
MKICLVSPGTATQWLDPELALSSKPRELAADAPLGPLSLAAILRTCGYEVSFHDTNRSYFDYLEAADFEKQPFSDYMVERLKAVAADVFGLSTICSSYPLTLRVATRLREVVPGAPIVVGGPQASVVDRETMAAYPAVDAIVRGEAEQSFPLLIERFAADTDLSGLNGITYRSGEEIVRAPASPLLENLDLLPLPAYDLFADFDPRQPIALELGRGCPFGCTFCSTNDFFRRRFRLKSPGRLIEEMSLLADRYGAPSFELVHDMFTVDRKRVVAFCRALLECGRRFVWNCSARTDCVDEELLDLMAAAGCSGIFFGVESGSPRIQKIIGKRLDLEEARRHVKYCHGLGMTPTVSVIIGFPEETRQDMAQSIDVFADACCLEKAQPQVHLLAPLAGTPVQRQHVGRLEFDELYSDMSHQGWRQDPVDRAMIAEHPEIFPNFYSLPLSMPRQFVNHVRNILMFGHAHFRWLTAALIRETDYLRVVDRWLEWAGKDVPKNSYAAEQYYGSRDFAQRFIRFLRVEVLPGHESAAAFEALIDYSLAFIGAEENIARAAAAPGAELREIGPGDVLGLEPRVCTFELQYEMEPLLQALRERRKLPEPGRRNSLVLMHRNGKSLQAWVQPPMAATALRCIDGTSALAAQAGRFARDSNGCSEAAFLIAVEQFLARGWVRAMPAGSTR